MNTFSLLEFNIEVHPAHFGARWRVMTNEKLHLPRYGGWWGNEEFRFPSGRQAASVRRAAPPYPGTSHPPWERNRRAGFPWNVYSSQIAIFRSSETMQNVRVNNVNREIPSPPPHINALYMHVHVHASIVLSYRRLLLPDRHSLLK